MAFAARGLPSSQRSFRSCWLEGSAGGPAPGCAPTHPVHSFLLCTSIAVLAKRIYGKFPLRLIQAMGSSEAGNIFANPQAPEANKIGTPGKAWGFETRIVSPDGGNVAVGQPGEVLIRGDAVMRGYYKDPEQTKAVLDAEGWLHTGDLAYQDEDGYFFIIGRSKELIIKGGMNIAPRQIDEVLESHPAVLEAAVVGVPDRYLGEDLIAYVVLRKGQTIDESALLSFCETRLGHFKTPTHIHFVPDLPKGPSGKVQRLRLLEVEATTTAGVPNGNTTGASETSPKAVEDALLQSWSGALNQTGIGRDVNFFALGGHSLAAIKCLAAIREKLAVVLSLSDFFEHPTVAQQFSLIAERLHPTGNLNRGAGRSQASSPAPSSAVPMTGGGAQAIPVNGRTWSHPLSSGQQRLWFFEELAPGVPLYNESEAVRLIGELQVPAMEQALNLVIARHEMLHSTIRKTEQGPEVLVHPSFTLRLKHIDRSTLPPAQSAAAVDRFLIEEPRAPYDLANTPGIRATLIRLAPTEHVFILMMHHLVCDWASEGVIWRELSSAYRALMRGETPNLPSLPIQYGDYAIWQQKRITDGAFAEDLDFWAKTLEGAPELLDLPTDRPRPQVQSYRGARQGFRVNADLTEAVRSCSRSEKSSLFAFYTAALNALLYRYSHCEDIVLGIPISERERPELASVIGFLLHTHALRTRLAGEMTFRELLAQVQKSALELYTHREVPFEQVVNRLRPQRSMSHSPLFQVMINWRDQDQHLSFIGLDGLEVESLLAEARTSKFDLTFQLTDFGEEIWLELEYNTDLFDDDRITRMFGHFATLLQTAAADPSCQLDQLQLLTDAERRQLLVDWNATEADYPCELCIHQLFEQQASRTPEAVAVVFADSQITYRELDQRSNRLARHLRKLGVTANRLVAICVERSIEMMVGLLGILKAGGGYVPLDPAYPQERLTFMLNDSGAALMLTESKLRERVPEDCATFCLDLDWQRIAKEDDSALEPEAGPANLAYVIYTSGSTGKPKGAEITHRSVVNLLCSMRERPGLVTTDTLLAVTTLSFDIAVLELFLPLIVGAKLVIASRETAIDGAALLELMQKSGVSVIQATPITFRILIAAGWAPGRSLVKVLCGGEALPRALADEILDRAGELWNCYGPTETTVWSTCAKIAHDAPVAIGKPIANTVVRVLDSSGELCPVGIPGELYIGGAGLARRYLGRPDLTAKRFVADRYATAEGARLYRTGDLVRYQSDGDLEHVGRLDHQVKIRGFRIELGEIEATLQQQPGVSQCVAMARSDVSGEKQIVAYVVAQDPMRPPSASDLRHALVRKLPAYMIPAAFVILDRLPLTANGKIDRKALPSHDFNTLGLDSIAPRTDFEDALAEIWAQVLGAPTVSVRDDFFAIGGHSLLAVRLIDAVHKSFGPKFSLKEFFQNPTIEWMAKVLEQGERTELQENAKAFCVVIRRGTKALGIVDEDTRLIPLQAAEGRPAFFMVDSFPYFIDVVKLLGGDQPVMSLVSRDRVSASSDYRIATEAAGHVQTMLEYQPSGPYMIGGCSASGIIAYEIAQQLQGRGLEVGLLTLFDTRNPYFTQEYSAVRRTMAYKLAALNSLRWTEVPGRAAAALARLAATRFRALTNGSTDRHPDAKADLSIPPQYRIATARLAAVRNYRPMPYIGRLLLFTAFGRLGGRYRDARLGWGEVARGQFDVHYLAAHEHLEIFKADSDRTLIAGKLCNSIDEVISRSSLKVNARQPLGLMQSLIENDDLDGAEADSTLA